MAVVAAFGDAETCSASGRRMRTGLSPWHLGRSTFVAAEAGWRIGRQPWRQMCQPVPR